VSQEELQAAAQEIAAELQETEQHPLWQISQLLKHCGLDFTRGLLEETRQIEADGGMMLPDNSRRRTIGGVFFYLARQKVPKNVKPKIFPYQQQNNQPKDETPPLRWGDRMPVLEALLDEKGELTTVKVTLIGRPGRVENRKDVYVTAMTHVIKSPALPKGVPKPPDTPTLYTVYIGAKQWRRVEEAIKDPQDALIIEGLAAFDPEIKGMAVFANSVTTKNLENKKRQEQREKAGSTEGESAPESSAPTKPIPPLTADNRPTRQIPEMRPSAIPPAPSFPVPPKAPPEVVQKLTELHAAAALHRQKIASIEAKPEGQQFGLEMTRKLLKGVEEQINILTQRYS
jgi:hypothetical protein